MQDTLPIDYEYYPVRDCWFDIAYDLLNLANDCLTDTPYGNPSSAFVSDAEPDFTCEDFISVYPHTLRPIQFREGAFPEENFQAVENCSDIYHAPRFEITVGRPCRPVMDARSKLTPRPASDKERTLHARAIYADAQMLSTCVTQKIAAGYPMGNTTFSPSEVFPQQVYIDSFGLVTRIRFRVMFDMNCSCTPDQLGYDDPDWVNRQLTFGPLGREFPPLKSIIK